MTPLVLLLLGVIRAVAGPCTQADIGKSCFCGTTRDCAAASMCGFGSGAVVQPGYFHNVSGVGTLKTYGCANSSAPFFGCYNDPSGRRDGFNVGEGIGVGACPGNADPTQESGAVNSSSNASMYSAFCCVSSSVAAPVVGSSSDYPAASCEDVANRVCNAPSGLYWIQARTGSGGVPKQYYCDMTMNGGGWLLLFERKTNDTCPNGLMRNAATGFCMSDCTRPNTPNGCPAVGSMSLQSPFDFRTVRGQVRGSYQ
ncbi:MAG: hypothetical protein IPK82_23160 [Polyangiaceae bacterium]|nr:hypothetical protein [Polyangiaceae bacterium]